MWVQVISLALLFAATQPQHRNYKPQHRNYRKLALSAIQNNPGDCYETELRGWMRLLPTSRGVASVSKFQVLQILAWAYSLYLFIDKSLSLNNISYCCFDCLLLVYVFVTDAFCFTHWTWRVANIFSGTQAWSFVISCFLSLVLCAKIQTRFIFTHYFPFHAGPVPCAFLLHCHTSYGIEFGFVSRACRDCFGWHLDCRAVNRDMRHWLIFDLFVLFA